MLDGTRRHHRRSAATTSARTWPTSSTNCATSSTSWRTTPRFNGINLLRGDKLKLTFNETGTSTIDIQAKNADGTAIAAINVASLGITTSRPRLRQRHRARHACCDSLSDALSTLRSQASAFGSNLSIVQNRQDFTKAMINTLQTGADNLVLADTNEEAANLLALQTRQQLSSTALSLASQADQAVLRLF